MGIRRRLLVLSIGIAVPLTLVGLVMLWELWQRSRRELDQSIEEQSDRVGLGLYLARTIVDQLGGRMAVEAANGEGTVFTLFVPIPQEERGETRKNWMSKRLLIVDDEPNLLHALAACLRTEGYDVEAVRSGEEALVRVAQGLPDLIISDIRMPRMDGHALARQLRANSRTDLIPIVFLTAKDDMTDRIAGFRSGVDAYLAKPFEPDELVAVIDNILRRVERTHAESRARSAGWMKNSPSATKS